MAGYEQRISAAKREHEMVRVEMVFVSRAIEGKAQKITFVATRFLVYPVLSEDMSRMDFIDEKVTKNISFVDINPLRVPSTLYSAPRRSR